ncbi:MAG: response regulator, partial [Leptospiraceae bacterium]|nr:response regulator [Leptospiraceae bacterium]
MKNILLIEDDLINSKTINEKLNQFGYYITNAYDGKSGLELFKKINPPVTIIGSSIPNIGVDKLVQKIKDYNTNAIILLESSHVDDNSKNKILISNIFYLIDKPIDFEKFPKIVEKAYSEASKLNKKHYKEFEEKQKVLEEIEIQKQKNLIANRIRIAKKEQDASIFYYLKTYLSQGAGIGVLVSIIKMMLFRPLIEDNKYLIGEDIMEMLRDNLIIVDNVLNTFEELDYLTTNELSLEEVSYFELLSLLLNSKEKVDHYSNHKEHSITFSDSVDQSKNHKFLVNKEFIEKVFYELLIN